MQYIITGQKRSDAKKQWKVMVDDEDYDYLKQFDWHVSKDKCVSSAMGSHKNKRMLIHRLLMKAPDDMEVDHIDGNRLNNQRSNLRLATSSQNKCNRGARKDNRSGFKGVSWHKKNKNWNVRIKADNKYLLIGIFQDKFEAAKAYNEAATKYHGEFAYINTV